MLLLFGFNYSVKRAGPEKWDVIYFLGFVSLVDLFGLSGLIVSFSIVWRTTV